MDLVPAASAPAPVPLLASVPGGGGRLHVAACVGNRVLVVPLGGGGGGGAPPAVTTVQWAVLSPSERRLAYDSLPLYEDAVTSALAPKRGRPDRAAAARRYASAVAALLAPTDDAGDDDDGLALERAAWDWTALLFVGGRRGDGVATPDVAAWAATHAGVLATGPTLAGEAGRLLALDAPETDAAYWPAVARAAATGAAGVAVDLLGAHSAWGDALAAGGGGGADERTLACVAALEAVGLLLRRWPRLGGDGETAAAAPPSLASAPDAHASLSTFLDAKRTWLAAVRACAGDGGLWARAGAGDAATAAGARAVVAVLCGEPAALEDAAADGGWPDLLAARALHGGGSGPRGAAELAHAARRAAADVAARGGPAAADPASPARDALLLGVADAAARGEPESAAAALSGACGAWLQATAAPLLLVNASSPFPAAQFAALEYAAALAAAPATRSAAARVLARCPGAGRAGAAALFERWGAAAAAAAGDDGPADDAVAVATSVGLADAAAGVARGAGAAHWRAGRAGAAAAWFARAGDGDRGAAVVGAVVDGGDADAVALEDLAPSLAALAAAPRATLAPRRGGVSGAAALLAFERALADDPPCPATVAASAAAAVRACPAAAAVAILFRAVPAFEAGGVPAATVDDALAALAEAKAGQAEEEDDVNDTRTSAVRLALARAVGRAFCGV